MDIVTATHSYESWLGELTPLYQPDIEYKHSQMADPFPFFRGTYYRWMQLWKEKAGELADTVKEKAGEAWERLNSPETKAQLEHLKDQAVEKLNEAEESLQQLGNKARDMWNKATHTAQPSGSPEHPAEHHDDPSKD